MEVSIHRWGVNPRKIKTEHTTFPNSGRKLVLSNESWKRAKNTQDESMK